MTKLSRRVILSGVAGCAAAAPVRSARAAPYPDRPITLVVPFAPGGSTDILARIVAENLYEALGQPVVVENRSGASGNIGTAIVARSAPDGYTFLFNTMSVHTMNHALFAAMPFDGVDDFSPISLLAYVTNTMVLHPSVPANTVREFIGYAKANSGKIAYASAGAGSTNHLCGALFEKMAQVAMVHVPYRGGAPAIADTVAGKRNSCSPPARRASNTLKPESCSSLLSPRANALRFYQMCRPWPKPCLVSKWRFGTPLMVPPVFHRRLSRGLMGRSAAFFFCPL